MIFVQTVRIASANTKGRRSANAGKLSCIFSIGANHFNLHYPGMCIFLNCTFNALCAASPNFGDHLFIILYVSPVGPAAELVGRLAITWMNSSIVGGAANVALNSALA